MQSRLKQFGLFWCAASIAATSLFAQSTRSPAYPYLRLEGLESDCSGYFQTAHRRLTWTTPHNYMDIDPPDRCTAPYRVISHKGMDWVLGIEPSKSCPFSVVHIRKDYPD